MKNHELLDGILASEFGNRWQILALIKRTNNFTQVKLIAKVPSCSQAPAHGTTCTPKLLALPTTILAMDSRGRCFICSSVDLILAISYTCLRLIVPVMSCPGLPDPFSMPAALFRKYDAGGVLVMKVKERSGCTVMRVGVGTPCSMWAVLALNSLQKSMDLTPRAPRAGPTGGVGAAFPAGTRRRTTCALALRAAFDITQQSNYDRRKQEIGRAHV